MAKSDTRFIAIGGGGQTEETLDELFAPIEKMRDPRVAVMTVATNEEEGITAKYNAMFRKRGIDHVSVVKISVRDDAFSNTALKKIEKADLIYFTGGDQLNVTSLFGGSPLHDLLHGDRSWQCSTASRSLVDRCSGGSRLRSQWCWISGCG